MTVSHCPPWLVNVILTGVLSGPLAAQPASSTAPVGATAPWGPAWAVTAVEKAQPWVQPLFPSSHEAVSFPDWYPDADFGADTQPQPTVIRLAPQIVRTIPDVGPSRPVRSTTHEYEWETSSNENSRPTFAIVMKDGTVKLALSTCIQGRKLTYVTTEHTGAEVALESVNLEATRRANPRTWSTDPPTNSSKP
jgi:hypothetical protein